MLAWLLAPLVYTSERGVQRRLRELNDQDVLPELGLTHANNIKKGQKVSLVKKGDKRLCTAHKHERGG